MPGSTGDCFVKIEIEVEEAVYKFLETMAPTFGLTVSEYVSSNVNATVLFSMAHRDELRELYKDSPEIPELVKYAEKKRNKIKEDRK